MGDYWDITIASLQPLISRPTLKPQLLQKPPFRFLHDIVTNCLANTGFPAGLFGDEHLKSENVKDKDQKLYFLSRLQSAVELSVGHGIDVQPNKITAGLEAEKTNALLQAMAEAARGVKEGRINMQQIVEAVDRGDKPGAASAAAPPPAAQSAPAPAAAKPRPAATSTPAPTPLASSTPSSAPAPAPAAAAAAPAPVSNGPFRPVRAPLALPPPAPGEDFVATTTRLIGALISKPRMVDKLLRKPPFRFIHDIITNTMAATGYPEGFFSADELNSGNFTDTGAKLSFLQRLILLVSITNGVDLSQVNPKKIAAGLEAENTNLLLQQFAYAAASGISAREVAAKVGDQSAADAPAQTSVAEQEAAAAAAAAEEARKAKVAAEAEARKNAALAASAQQQQQQQAAKPMPKLQGLSGLASQDQSEDATAAAGAGPSMVGGASNDEPQRQKIERPKTARKAPPKLPSNLIVEEKTRPPSQQQQKKKDGTDEGARPGSRMGADKMGDAALGSGAGVIAEGANAPDEDEDADDDDEEAEHLLDAREALAGFDSTNGGEGGGDEGALVKAMKNKLKEGAADATGGGGGGMKIRSSLSSHAGGLSSAQLDDLRKQIQSLCQSVNPLGKVVECVREDMDAMNKELARWKHAYNEYSEQLEEERRASERIVEPLQQALKTVDKNIAEQQRKIHAIKQSILRNDATIAQLLDQKTAVEGTGS